jgi:hypothetical protein
MGEEEYKKELRSWESGEKCIVVATSVIGCGYDYPHVRMVLHRSMFFSLADYHQQSGRCGRDGHPRNCEVVYSRKYHERWVNHLTQGDGRCLKEEAAEELSVATGWIQNNEACRQWGLHKEMDGSPQRCSLVPGGLYCNVCTCNSNEDTAALPWEPMLWPHYKDLNAADIANGDWGLPPAPAVIESDSVYHDDLLNFRKEELCRKFKLAASRLVARQLCSLCSSPVGLPKQATRHAQVGSCELMLNHCL